MYIKPRLRDFGQPLLLAAHASDWGDSSNRRRSRGGQTEHHMVMLFVGVGGVVLMLG
jgi:hypothetical protein